MQASTPHSQVYSLADRFIFQPLLQCTRCLCAALDHTTTIQRACRIPAIFTLQCATPQGGWQQQQAGGLQRSNSAPDLRLLLAPPLQPLLSIPPAFVQQYASASTAGALVPYKAPEVSLLPCFCAASASQLLIGSQPHAGS